MTTEELLLKAKIPCPETGIEVRHSMCDICTPGPQCGLDVYVKDGKIIKIEGTKGFPSNNGKLCTKGAANRQYVYREDRIHGPMRRIGPRGSGQFQPVSWDEAFSYAADKLNEIKRNYGPESVAFMCGYSKWFRAFLQRLAYSFGSPNYSTESSACHRAEVMSYRSVYGCSTMPNISGTKLFIAWGSNAYINAYPMGRGLNAFKEHGGRIVVIDPRNTQAAQKLADIHLRPKLGTDGALAHGMAKIIIENGWIDTDFIEKYVHGFEQYRDYVMQFDLDRVEKITGVPAADIYAVAKEFATTNPSIIHPSNAITHHINGYNNHRAILSLMVITGRFDRPGTVYPENETFTHSDGGFKSREAEFATATRPVTDKPTIGHLRFPLFKDLVDEGQGMDFIRQVMTEDPYPIHAAVMFGVNHRMYPESPKFLKALEKLDFVVADDLVWTEVCKYADIVLPASTSLERSEIKCYGGKFINYTKPAIDPVWDNRDDVAIITGLANALDLDDELLRSGYDKCLQYIMADSGIEDWDAFRMHDGPIPVPNAKHYQWGTYLKAGANTPSGKLELYSEFVAKYQDSYGLNPLPVYESGDDPADSREYPFTLCTGARLPNAVHTRTHKLSWPRSLRPDASVDINPADAETLEIAQGETVRLSTPAGSIRLKANITEVTSIGELQMYHGYQEANANDLLSAVHLDPYTGFPGYKQMRCRLTKEE